MRGIVNPMAMKMTENFAKRRRKMKRERIMYFPSKRKIVFLERLPRDVIKIFALARIAPAKKDAAQFILPKRIKPNVPIIRGRISLTPAFFKKSLILLSLR